MKDEEDILRCYNCNAIMYETKRPDNEPKFRCPLCFTSIQKVEFWSGESSEDDPNYE